MPGSPTERQQAVVDPPPAELHPCPFCGERHQPVRLGGGGLLAYAQPIAAAPWETGRPRPLGREPGDTSSLVRDSFRPWHRPPAAEPPPPGSLTLRERIVGWWEGDES